MKNKIYYVTNGDVKSSLRVRPDGLVVQCVATDSALSLTTAWVHVSKLPVSGFFTVILPCL